tara:strand:+ start:3075 stop:3263 length:189 start_codon:yes stop_codon:yes gene_type:complete
MDIKEKLGNLITQKKKVKLEITELEDALLIREELLNKIEGAIEFASALEEEDKPKKKEKKDA